MSKYFFKSHISIYHFGFVILVVFVRMCLVVNDKNSLRVVVSEVIYWFNRTERLRLWAQLGLALNGCSPELIPPSLGRVLPLGDKGDHQKCQDSNH